MMGDYIPKVEHELEIKEEVRTTIYSMKKDGDLVGFQPLTQKRNIDGLDEDQVEYGETLVLREMNVKAEHNFPGLSVIHGLLICTNYKLIFGPSERQPPSMDARSKQLIVMPHVCGFFTLPLGYIFSIEVKTILDARNRVKNSSLEVISKDGRKLNLILKDYDQCVKAREIIRAYAYMDQMSPDRFFENTFAKAYFLAVTGSGNNLNRKLIEKNKLIWSFYEDPIKEFLR